MAAGGVSRLVVVMVWIFGTVKVVVCGEHVVVMLAANGRRGSRPASRRAGERNVRVVEVVVCAQVVAAGGVTRLAVALVCDGQRQLRCPPVVAAGGISWLAIVLVCDWSGRWKW